VKAEEGKIGRVFILRLEHGDNILESIAEFAEKKKISVGLVTLIGGIEEGEVVAGPRKTEDMPPEPIILPLEGAHDVVGMGVIAPGSDGKPALHMHAAMGRAGKTLAGCLRSGVNCWLIGEVLLFEITNSSAKRVMDEQSGFCLLEP